MKEFSELKFSLTHHPALKKNSKLKLYIKKYSFIFMKLVQQCSENYVR